MDAAYLYQPREVSIETFTLCNARCTFCPYPTLDRKGTKMDTSTLLRLHEEMRDFKRPFFFSPFKVNEPLLDDRLESYCQLIDEENPMASLRLFTNGQPLTMKTLEWIAKLKRVEHLWVSLNSTNPVEYRTLMGLDLFKVIQKLDGLHWLIVNQKFPHKVVVSRVKQDCPEDVEFLKWCGRYWPRFDAILLDRKGWLGHVEPSNPTIPAKPCVRWEELSVMSDGRVALCCMDGTGEFAIGNVHEKTLLEIYNDPKLTERRRRKLSRYEVGEPCHRCNY